ncbi:MAG: rod shape-determining protein RodA [Candidatus Aminicenantes bacterium]|nr:rod shape-determining protein RodA [Candidatus Aminicenantes bacterium]
MLDRSHFQSIDWILIALTLVNSFIGVVMIHSSAHYIPGSQAQKQIFFIFIGILFMFVFISVDYNFFVEYSPYIYLIVVLVLWGMLMFGSLTAGTKSWIRLPFIRIQPSEITKVAMILVLAYLFREFRPSFISIKLGLFSSGLVAIPLFLVALQPDLGTALTYLPILLGALLLAGINKKTWIWLIIIALVLGFLGWNFFLKDYQKDRIRTLIFPQKDPLGTGYHTLQSKIAIGSGGLFGKGYKEGTQSQLRFLPARHTDFIFSVIGEEFGFAGIIVVLSLYFIFISRLLISVYKSRDRAGVYIVFMVFLMFASQFLINVLMTVGLLPVAGIPLPLYSYGGSSLVTNYIAVGLVVNVKMRRFVNI